MKPRIFVVDVDGVMTTGQFLYSASGKAYKVFGPDDNDALTLLKAYVEIQFVSGDRKGFDISQRRIVDDMGFPLTLVSTFRRIEWIREQWDTAAVIYMGDGIFDHYVFRNVGYSIAPQNADAYAKTMASYVTQRAGGERAVAEACLHILEKFFEPYNPEKVPNWAVKRNGE